MKDIILIPTYNEKENIEVIIPEIFNMYPQISVMVIDDNSPDKTGQRVKELIKQYPNLSLLERECKTGLGNAYKDAIKNVIKDSEVRSIITMDADGSHSPNYIKNFLDNIDRYDLIIGSRYVSGGGVENWEFWRKFLSKSGNFYAKFLTGLKINDLTSGFICYRKKSLEHIDYEDVSSAGYSFQIELKFYLIKNLNSKFIEIPIIFKSRRSGESKLSSHIIIEGVKTPLCLLAKRLRIRNLYL